MDLYLKKLMKVCTVEPVEDRAQFEVNINLSLPKRGLVVRIIPLGKPPRILKIVNDQWGWVHSYMHVLSKKFLFKLINLNLI